MLGRMIAIDSHAHISLKHFDDDRDDVLRRAREKGVLAIINPTINPPDFDKALRISKKYRGFVYVSLGLPPQTASEKDLQVILEYSKKYEGRYIAIGECGIDYYWIHDPEGIERMTRIFKRMLELAKEAKLPVIIHARTAHGKNAYRDIVKILKDYGIEKAVFHAFFGRKSDLRIIIENGWYIGIPTVYLRRRELWDIVRQTPLDTILIETDSPYLSPEKGKRNEPANVLMLVDLISKILNKDPHEVSMRILENTLDFFNIKAKNIVST